MKNKRKLKIIPRIPSLKALGIGVEHFPEYVNLKPDAHHSLDIILMSFIVKGEVIHHLEDESYLESDLSLSITNYGQEHNITTTKDGADIINIYLDLKHYNLPVLPEALQEFLPLFLPSHISLQNRLNRMLRINFTETDKAVSLLLEMKNELSEQKPGYEMVVKDFLRIFLIKCARKVQHRNIKPAAKINSHSLERLERLRQFIDQHYKRQFEIAELARMSGFSRNYLCRIFKNYTGQTLTEYTNERRIQAAMLLLKSTSKQVIEIANLAGFNDLSHFNHLFKKITGISPSKFRKQ